MDLGDAHFARNVCKGLHSWGCDWKGVDAFDGPHIRNAACSAQKGSCAAAADRSLCEEIRAVFVEPRPAGSHVLYATRRNGAASFDPTIDIAESYFANDPSI